MSNVGGWYGVLGNVGYQWWWGPTLNVEVRKCHHTLKLFTSDSEKQCPNIVRCKNVIASQFWLLVVVGSECLNV